ncbi:nitroreductase [Bordetella genomosp. 13]|uniref:nitroreductase n=1 Tax=Bordetella genomosp. 13 TaxID=463040 RepID=UPI0011A073BC|nr:nitroreductase [Bordetella genomosp. 13]
MDSSARFDPPSLSLAEAMRTRRSIRAFLPDPVPQPLIERVLELASRAPSGNNAQPWKVYVITGAARQRFAAALRQAYDDPDQSAYQGEYAYYPKQWIAPFQDRRRKVGWDLYGLLGITREDKAGMHAQHARNYDFFDAPVGLMFTINRIMSQGSWLDYGMFLQSVMLSARAHGLDTCPQAAFVPYHAVVARELGLPPDEMLVCGMALGYADPGAIENTLHSEREPVEGFARFIS